MNRILNTISPFNIGSPRRDLPEGSTETPSRNEDPGPVPQSQRTGEWFYPPPRQSTFGFIRLKSKKGEDITAEKVVDRQKFNRGRREDLRQILINEKAELVERISVLEIEVERKSKLLRSVIAEDDAEKWCYPTTPSLLFLHDFPTFLTLLSTRLPLMVVVCIVCLLLSQLY